MVVGRFVSESRKLDTKNEPRWEREKLSTTIQREDDWGKHFPWRGLTEKVCHRRPHSSNLISEGLRQPVPHYFLLFSTFLKAGRNTEHIRDQRSNTEHSRGQRRTTEHSRDQNGAQPRGEARGDTARSTEDTRDGNTRRSRTARRHVAVH